MRLCADGLGRRRLTDLYTFPGRSQAFRQSVSQLCDLTFREVTGQHSEHRRNREVGITRAVQPGQLHCVAPIRFDAVSRTTRDQRWGDHGMTGGRYLTLDAVAARSSLVANVEFDPRSAEPAQQLRHRRRRVDNLAMLANFGTRAIVRYRPPLSCPCGRPDQHTSPTGSSFASMHEVAPNQPGATSPCISRGGRAQPQANIWSRRRCPWFLLNWRRVATASDCHCLRAGRQSKPCSQTPQILSSASAS